MEVEGHQRSNVVNYMLWLPNLVRRIPDTSLWWWWPSWRSKVIKGQIQKLCAMATKLSQKKPWCKFMMMMMTFMKVKGHQRSNVVNVALWLPNLVRKNPWCKLMMVMTFMKVKGHQRSNVVNFALWLPNLVKRIANAMEVKGQMGLNLVNYVPWLQTWSEGHWWQSQPALRSKVNRGQIW